MQIVNIARRILFWLFVVIVFAMTVFTIVSVSTFDQMDRSLFGYKAFIVLTDSMKKTDFASGDLVLIKEVDPTTLQSGDIVCYISQNSNTFGKTVTHKIRRVTTTADGEPGFVTYGTTTDTDDEIVVTYPFVLGKYQFRIPNLGHFFQFLKTTPGYILCILLPFLALIAVEVVHCIRLLIKHRRQQQLLLQMEREQIEADRAENQRMLQELLTMQQQLHQESNQPPSSDPAGV